MTSPTEPDYKALLIEALARLMALDNLPGDPGGPFYCRDAEDLTAAMRWIGCVHSDPPDWGQDCDPLEALYDDSKVSEFEAAVVDRSEVLLNRLREQLIEYYKRVAETQPERAAKWRPWWRTRR